jgi:hypothetical protein
VLIGQSDCPTDRVQCLKLSVYKSRCPTKKEPPKSQGISYLKSSREREREEREIRLGPILERPPIISYLERERVAGEMYRLG